MKIWIFLMMFSSVVGGDMICNDMVNLTSYQNRNWFTFEKRATLREGLKRCAHLFSNDYKRSICIVTATLIHTWFLWRHVSRNAALKWCESESVAPRSKKRLLYEHTRMSRGHVPNSGIEFTGKLLCSKPTAKRTHSRIDDPSQVSAEEPGMA